MKIDINGISLNYETMGEGPALVMLHGNGEDHRIFLPMTKVLKKYFTVYLIDSRDHGQSQRVKTLNYEDMAGDVAAFINAQKLEKPILYGFSDGGIVGLLVAIHHPDLLSALIISGANVNPRGIKKLDRALFRALYLVIRSNKLKLMLKQPHITDQQLQSITVPTHITAGSDDMIKDEHTRHIHKNIPKSVLTIYPKHNHDSYIFGSNGLLHYIIRYFGNPKK